MAELLSHPMVLLLVTALISGLLVPRLTQQWQQRRQQIDTRRDLAARAARTVGEMYIATQLAHVGAASQSQQDFDAAYVRWEVESATLGAELRAYFRDDAVARLWERCRGLTSAYYVQVGIREPERRSAYLMDVHGELGLDEHVDIRDAHMLRAHVLSARDQLIEEVLTRRMR